MVEVALSILVVAVGLLGVFALFPVGLNAGREAEDESEMLMVADFVFANLQAYAATNYTQLAQFTCEYNDTVIPVQSSSPVIMREDGFTPICRVRLEVQPEDNYTHVTLTCVPGDGKLDQNPRVFYTRCTKWSP